MGDLSLLAEWVRSPLEDRDYFRLVKVSNAVLDEVRNVSSQLAPKIIGTAGLVGGGYLSAKSGLGEHNRVKAMFDPAIIRRRLGYYGGPQDEL